MTITYDATVDATDISLASGTYYMSVPLEQGGVDFVLDIDREGRVLKLEVLAVSQLFGLIERYGRQLVVPERLEDPETFDVWGLFPRAPAHV